MKRIPWIVVAMVTGTLSSELALAQSSMSMSGSSAGSGSSGSGAGSGVGGWSLAPPANLKKKSVAPTTAAGGTAVATTQRTTATKWTATDGAFPKGPTPAATTPGAATTVATNGPTPAANARPAVEMPDAKSTKIDVKNLDNGVTITFTSIDPAATARLQKMAQAMRLMHEAMNP